jgi:hypothetical protein
MMVYPVFVPMTRYFSIIAEIVALFCQNSTQHLIRAHHYNRRAVVPRERQRARLVSFELELCGEPAPSPPMRFTTTG